MSRRLNAMVAVIQQDDAGYPPEFVEVDGGRVHVAVPHAATPNLGGTQEDRQLEMMLRMGLGVTFTVCGLRIERYRGGMERYARMVSSFSDERLCRSCWAAFDQGDRYRIFEANRRPEEEDQ